MPPPKNDPKRKHVWRLKKVSRASTRKLRPKKPTKATRSEKPA